MTWIWYTREETFIGLQSYVNYKGLKCVGLHLPKNSRVNNSPIWTWYNVCQDANCHINFPQTIVFQITLQYLLVETYWNQYA
jgi:hypothetical protein